MPLLLVPVAGDPRLLTLHLRSDSFRPQSLRGTSCRVEVSSQLLTSEISAPVC